MNIYAFIPARYGSVRFRGKPLADICGMPMIEWVYLRTKQCKALKKVIVATDDPRIAAVIDKHDPADSYITSGEFKTGADRIFSVAKLICNDDDIIVNVQGDEPCIRPDMIDALIDPFVLSNRVRAVTTLATSIDPWQAQDHNRVKVVVSKAGRALYFSRSMVPYQNVNDYMAAGLGPNNMHPYYCHIGVYAYRMDILKLFFSMESTPLEKAERLEQLRFLENDIPIDVAIVDYAGQSVDAPEDIEAVETFLMSAREGKVGEY